MKTFTEKEWQEFNKRFSAIEENQEVEFEGRHAFWICFFVMMFVLCVLKVWGLIW